MAGGAGFSPPMSETATFSGIDLSRLVAPDLIEPLSYETIYAQMLARLKSFLPDFDDSLESDPAVRVLQVAAWFRLLDRQRVNDAASAVMVAYATGGDLDNLGALVGVPRLENAPADPDTATPAVMEADEDFRRRIVLAPEGFSVAGPGGAYIFRALGADGDVLDASAISPDPAVVEVYVLSRTGTGAASPGLVAAVDAALSADLVRPIADRLTVQSAGIVDYAVDADLTTFDGPDPAVVVAAAGQSLAAWIAAQNRIGRDITRAGIIAALMVEGMQNVDLASPAADVVIDATQAGHCTGVTLTHIGTGG